jgi:hypothetical protein
MHLHPPLATFTTPACIAHHPYEPTLIFQTQCVIALNQSSANVMPMIRLACAYTVLLMVDSGNLPKASSAVRLPSQAVPQAAMAIKSYLSLKSWSYRT